MADVFDKEKRSWVMSRITGGIAWGAGLYATKPERLLRSLLHRRGFRFTVNGPFNKTLP
jgi:DNA mismatch endonuclease (patch repair protein)